MSAEKLLPLKMLFMILHFITHSSLRKLAWDSFAKVCFKKGRCVWWEGSGGQIKNIASVNGKVTWEREHFVPA